MPCPVRAAFAHYLAVSRAYATTPEVFCASPTAQIMSTITSTNGMRGIDGQAHVTGHRLHPTGASHHQQLQSEAWAQAGTQAMAQLIDALTSIAPILGHDTLHLTEKCHFDHTSWQIWIFGHTFCYNFDTAQEVEDLLGNLAHALAGVPIGTRTFEIMADGSASPTLITTLQGMSTPEYAMRVWTACTHAHTPGVRAISFKEKLPLPL